MLRSFRQSFNDVYHLYPDQLQLHIEIFGVDIQRAENLERRAQLLVQTADVPSQLPGVEITLLSAMIDSTNAYLYNY